MAKPGDARDREWQKFRDSGKPYDETTKVAVCIEQPPGDPVPVTGSITFSGASSNKITGFPVTTANTEEEHQFTANTKQFLMRSRNGSKMRVAFTSGGTGGTDYVTINKGTVYTEAQIDYSGKVFFQTTATDVVEIVEWF